MKTSSRENCLGNSLALAVLAGACTASFCGGLLFCFVVYFGDGRGVMAGDQAATPPLARNVSFSDVHWYVSRWGTTPVESLVHQMLSVHRSMNYSHECFLSNRRRQTDELLARSRADGLRQWRILSSAAAPVAAGCRTWLTDDARQFSS